MRKQLVFLILLSLVLSGCGKQAPAQIAATTLPVYTFTEALCEGTELTVCRLVTEEVSCLHDYTVQVHQMRAVEAADTVVCSGAGLEEFLEDVLGRANHVIDASANIELSCGHEHEEHQHQHDPHIWLSPANAKTMCQNICAELTALYPQHQAILTQNLTDLVEQLDALQVYGEEQLKDLSYKELITFHDGFSYFAESFDLRILKAVEEESGSEASAKELAELIGLVNDHNLPAIFTETNGSTAAAQIIAAETGANIHTLDMVMAGNDYFEAMYRNIDTVKEALE